MQTPPLLFNFSSVDAFLSAYNTANAEEACVIKQLVAKNKPPVTSVKSLSTLFGFSPKLITAIRKQPSTYYRRFLIQKRIGTREICSPKVALKVIQKWFGYHLSVSCNLPDSVHGFVPKRSTLTAARIHCNAQWIFKADIKDFFPSVNAARVAKALINTGYEIHGAHICSKLFTLNDGLPQGSPCSPVLANLAFSPTDLRLSEAVESRGIQYTRYADDLVFSGNGDFPPDLPQLVEDIVSNEGWTLHPDKSQHMKRPQRLKAYGLLVHGASPVLPKEYRNQLRMMEHMLKAGNIDETTRHRFQGHLAYASSIPNFII